MNGPDPGRPGRRAEADGSGEAAADAGDGLRRLFVAAPLDDEANDRVRALVERVRAGEPEGRGVRWVRLEGLHLTLRFLGPVESERIDALAGATERAAVGQAGFGVRLSDAGAFPPHGRPRTLWLGVAHGGDELAALTERLNDELAAMGWPRDGRPFRAHLTLARADGVRAGPATAAALRNEAKELAIETRVDRVVLYESLTGGGRARYMPLHEVRLGPRGDDPVGGATIEQSTTPNSSGLQR